jgi:hypothetical protein
MRSEGKRPTLTVAQRRAIDNDDHGWIGWDAANQPVLSDHYGTYAIAKSGEPVAIIQPVEEL